MSFFRIKKNIFALLAVFIIAFIFAVPAQAASGDVSYSTFWTSADGIGAKAVAVVNIVLYGAFQLISIVLGIVAKMVDFAIQPTTSITGSLLVQNGWTITRDFANMFFILILLAIALAFILFPRYQIKSALPRLIIVALLINFSLPIAGFLIDISNVFSDYFVSQATGGVGTISTNIAASLHLQNVFDVQNVGQGSTTPSSFDLQVTAFQILLFGIAFIFMTSVVLLALGLMFLFRIAWLSFLLILLPIILVLSIVEKGLFSRWSNRFIRWTFFGPIALFFVYLSMASFSSLAGSPDANSWLEATSKESRIGLIKYIYQYIVIWMLLLMSLSVANMISGVGGLKAIAMGNKLKGVIAGGTGRILSRGGRVTKNLSMYGAERLGASTAIDKTAGALSRVPIAGAFLGRTTRRASVAFKKSAMQRGNISQAEEASFNSMSDAQKMSYFKDVKRTNTVKALKFAKMLQDKGVFAEKYDPNLTDEQNDKKNLALKKDVYEKAKALKDKEVMKAFEKSDHRIFEEKLKEDYKDVAAGEKHKETGLTMEDARSAYYRGFKPSDIEKLDESMLKGKEGEELLKNMQSYGNMSGEHLKAALKTNSIEFLKAFERSIESMGNQDIMNIRKNNPGFTKFLDGNAAVQFAGTKNLSKRIKEIKLNQLKDDLNKESYNSTRAQDLKNQIKEEKEKNKSSKSNNKYDDEDEDE